MASIPRPSISLSHACSKMSCTDLSEPGLIIFRSRNVKPHKSSSNSATCTPRTETAVRAGPPSTVKFVSVSKEDLYKGVLNEVTISAFSQTEKRKGLCTDTVIIYVISIRYETS